VRTDDLVKMLATGPVAAAPRVPRQRYALALGWAAFGAVLLTAVLLGVRADLAQAARLPMFWMKLGFVAALAAIALPVNLRLARPGARLGGLPAGLAVIVLLMWATAALVLLLANPDERAGLILGETWRTCPFNIAGLALPGLVGFLWAMKGLAPTRLRLAGAAAGLLSGAVAAVAYTLHCPELQAPFLAVWYLLGVLIPAAMGALIGPWLLRW